MDCWDKNKVREGADEVEKKSKYALCGNEFMTFMRCAGSLKHAKYYYYADHLKVCSFVCIPVIQSIKFILSF